MEYKIISGTTQDCQKILNHKATTEEEVKNHTGIATRLNGLLTDKGDENG